MRGSDKKLKRKLTAKSAPVSTVTDFIFALQRKNLREDRLYYNREGTWIDLYANIAEDGLPRGEYDSLEDEDWPDALNVLSFHTVRPD